MKSGTPQELSDTAQYKKQKTAIQKAFLPYKFPLLGMGYALLLGVIWMYLEAHDIIHWDLRIGWMLVILLLTVCTVPLWKWKRSSQLIRETAHRLRWIWFSTIISGLVVLLFVTANYLVIPIIQVLLAQALLLSGKILNYILLMIGGTVVWLYAVLCFIIPIDQQLVLLILTVVTGYLIPAHLYFIVPKEPAG